MLVERGYRPYTGQLRSGRWLPLARTGVLLIFRRKIFWLFLVLGLVNFLVYSSMVYFLAQLEAEFKQQGMMLPPFVRGAVFTGTGRSYRDFISMQNAVVMLFLAFAGSQLIGNDFRYRSISFYLSRPIGKLGYFLGKLCAAVGLTLLITLVPAVVLFVEYGLFTESVEYFRESWRIFLAILGYGTLVSVASSLLILSLAALLQRTVLIGVVWGGVFVFLPMVGDMFRFIGSGPRGDAWHWALLNYWAVLRWISNCFFGITEEPRRGHESLSHLPAEGLPFAIIVLAGWMVLALWLFYKRVKAVEVVR